MAYIDQYVDRTLDISPERIETFSVVRVAEMRIADLLDRLGEVHGTIDTDEKWVRLIVSNLNSRLDKMYLIFPELSGEVVATHTPGHRIDKKWVEKRIRMLERWRTNACTIFRIKYGTKPHEESSRFNKMIDTIDREIAGLEKCRLLNFVDFGQVAHEQLGWVERNLIIIVTAQRFGLPSFENTMSVKLRNSLWRVWEAWFDLERVEGRGIRIAPWATIGNVPLAHPDGWRTQSGKGHLWIPSTPQPQPYDIFLTVISTNMREWCYQQRDRALLDAKRIRAADLREIRSLVLRERSAFASGLKAIGRATGHGTYQEGIVDITVEGALEEYIDLVRRSYG